MDDRSTIRLMLDKAKIEYTETLNNEDGTSYLGVSRGYIGFAVEFKFKPDGSLEDLGAYE